MILSLTTFASRKNAKGMREDLSWDEFVRRLRDPIRTDETLDEYARLSNEERTDVKDVGGYVGGVFEGNQRAKDKLQFRSILVIDADHANGSDVEDFEVLYDTVFLCHSTHSSTKREPRLRWVFPLSRPVTAEEYRQLTNIVAEWVGEESIDETTDQPERLMFWPSVAKDAEYYCATGGSVVLNPDDYLDDYEEPPKPTPQIKSQTSDCLAIAEGQRNKTVFGFAAALRGHGLDPSGIRAMLEQYNDRYCEPPLPPEELDTITRSVCSHYQPGAAIAPTLRDAWDDFNDLGEWKESEPKQIKHLAAESLESLSERDVPTPVYAVEDLITDGITILASPPKFGKSWMCMDLAISVAKGEAFLGMETHQRGVIYLALEDGDFRLKDRSRKVANGTALPSNVLVVKEAPILKDGLLQMVVDLLDTCEVDVGMIIIDTLQKIRGVAGKTEGVYGYDYRELGQLHQFALDKHLAVVLVHHLNKGGDDTDFVSRLNGSTGVSGAADTIITLTRGKRKDDMTKMSITGRDVLERTLMLRMDWHNYKWICLGEEKEVEKNADENSFWSDPVVKTIIHFLDEAEDLLDASADHVEWRCTSSQLFKEVELMFGEQKDFSPTVVGRRVKNYQPFLETLANINYEYVKTNSKREHVFTRELI